MSRGEVGLSPAVACPATRYARPHTWRADAGADLVGYGRPDHGVTVWLGRCARCGAALLAVRRLIGDPDPAGPLFDVTGAEL